MKCKECKNNIESPNKYLAYYSNGKPVYWRLCDPCIKNMFLKYIKN